MKCKNCSRQEYRNKHRCFYHHLKFQSKEAYKTYLNNTEKGVK